MYIVETWVLLWSSTALNLGLKTANSVLIQLLTLVNDATKWMNQMMLRLQHCAHAHTHKEYVNEASYAYRFVGRGL